MKRWLAFLVLTAVPGFAVAQSMDALTPQVRKYVLSTRPALPAAPVAQGSATISA